MKEGLVNNCLFNNLRCHSFNNKGNIIASRNYKILTIDSHNLAVESLFNLREYSHGLSNSFHLLSRLLRRGIHHIQELYKDKYFIVMNGLFLELTKKDGQVDLVYHIQNGTRPLIVCLTKERNLYWSDYYGNPNRKEVNIYGLEDGEVSLNIVYTFPPGSIRHVHGVFHDPYDNKIWVTTGDADKESGIWVTDDHFHNLEKLVGGSQQKRAINLLFSSRYIYFGSDTPLEKNYIYRVDRKMGHVERIQEVESSVFWGCKVGDFFFFSTSIEPSKVNKCRDACIWGSPNGEDWKCIARLPKDSWPMKLFQYGQIFSPSGENKTDYLWFTPFATKRHLTLQRINIKEIF